MPDHWALLSVLNKDGIVDFAGFLRECGYGLLSTGGTRRVLVDAGLDVVEVSEFTGVKEMMHGRLKTLHPKIFGPILARPIDEDRRALEEQGWPPIDVVVVNLYDFAGAITDPDVTNATAIENVDIGGPSLIRAAAKNFERTLVVTDPADYDRVKSFMHSDGTVMKEFRFEQMQKAFDYTAAYDWKIADFFARRTASQ